MELMTKMTLMEQAFAEQIALQSLVEFEKEERERRYLREQERALQCAVEGFLRQNDCAPLAGMTRKMFQGLWNYEGEWKPCAILRVSDLMFMFNCRGKLCLALRCNVTSNTFRPSDTLYSLSDIAQVLSRERDDPFWED